MDVGKWVRWSHEIGVHVAWNVLESNLVTVIQSRNLTFKNSSWVHKIESKNIFYKKKLIVNYISHSIGCQREMWKHSEGLQIRNVWKNDILFVFGLNYILWWLSNGSKIGYFSPFWLCIHFTLSHTFEVTRGHLPRSGQWNESCTPGLKPVQHFMISSPLA